MLFDPAFLRLEHAVLSDTQVTFLVVSALTVLLWRTRPSVRACAAVGLLLALAGLTRTVAVPLLGLVLIHLIIQRVGRRQMIALAVAGLLPLVGYAGWYQAHHGRFALSGSDGVALWARTMTFADCSVIKPLPRRRSSARTAPWSTPPRSTWAAGASLNRLPGDRFSHNDLARSFALRAIAAQPLDYLGAVVHDTSLAFAWTPVRHPLRVSPALTFPHGSWPLPGFPLIDKVRGEYDGGIRGMSSVEPYGSVLAAYAPPAVLHGPLLGVMLLLGGLGSIGRRREALLPWATAVFLLVAPVAALDFDHRYVLPAIPMACLAAALGVTSLAARLRRVRPSVIARRHRPGSRT
ncbi:hypothetical protein ACFQX6_29105 [Streptosporangium lutulentum]